LPSSAPRLSGWARRRAFTDAVLGNTYDLPSSDMAKNQPFSADIGYRASASAYSHQVLSSGVQHPHRRAAAIPVHPAERLIVKRPNPVDTRH
jgi:hypothetical protein